MPNITLTYTAGKTLTCHVLSPSLDITMTENGTYAGYYTGPIPTGQFGLVDSGDYEILVLDGTKVVGGFTLGWIGNPTNAIVNERYIVNTIGAENVILSNNLIATMEANQQEVLDILNSAQTITVVGQVIQVDENISIYKGMDYLTTQVPSQAITWQDDLWSTTHITTLSWTLANNKNVVKLTKVPTFDNASKIITLQLTAAETVLLAADTYTYSVVATDSTGKKRTLITGFMTVKPPYGEVN